MQNEQRQHTGRKAQRSGEKRGKSRTGGEYEIYTKMEQSRGENANAGHHCDENTKKNLKRREKEGEKALHHTVLEKERESVNGLVHTLSPKEAQTQATEDSNACDTSPIRRKKTEKETQERHKYSNQRSATK